MEYAKKTIWVNAVCPGYLETGATRDWWAAQPDPEAARQYTYRLHPPRRIGTAGEVANAILFLPSDEASYISGVASMIDGRSVRYHD